MLANALLYEDQLEILMKETWYDDKYKFYHGTYNSYNDEKINDDYNKRSFVSVDPNGDVIGYIKYNVDRVSNQAYEFGMINFREPNIIFSMDVLKVVDDIFCKFNHQRMEWFVICGNPVEKQYDEFCKKAGGRIIGIHRRANFIDNIWYDNKSYEILREDYIKNRPNIIGKKKALKNVPILFPIVNEIKGSLQDKDIKWKRLKDQLSSLNKIKEKEYNNTPTNDNTNKYKAICKAEIELTKDILEIMKELEDE